jgi:dolichol-phosphate mannosyltransferase
MTSSKRISIIAPTFNEAGNVLPFIERIKSTLSNFDWEIIFVDDNSHDGTSETVFNYAINDPRVRVINRFNDRGLAKSSIQGLLSARSELLCVMDADGQHDPSVITEMADLLDQKHLDIVSAARRLDAGIQLDGLSATRQKLSNFGNWLCSLVIGRPMLDPLTGFFMIRREKFLKLVPQLGDPGFKLLLDILHTDKNLKHGEVLFDFGVRTQGESKLDAQVLWTFVTFLMSKMTGGIIPAALISFLIVGGSGVFVHLLALYGALAFAASFVAAQTFATLIAATSNFLLNNRLTFRDKRLRGSKMVKGYLKFLAVSAVGIIANVSAATVAYEQFINVVFIATLAGIAIDTVWKFVVANRFIWK